LLALVLLPLFVVLLLLSLIGLNSKSEGLPFLLELNGALLSLLAGLAGTVKPELAVRLPLPFLSLL
jgi:hypothetical protein